MFDFLPEAIDFLDEGQIEDLKNKMYDELRDMLNQKEYTITAFEEILFMTQSCIMPVIEEILDFKAFRRFSELKDAYQYVLEHWNRHEKRPYPKIEYFTNMCYDTGPIVGEDDEEARLTDEEVEILREEYFAELEQKEPDNGVITLCDYHILEYYFYFLDYFTAGESHHNNIDRGWYVNFCASRINDILFDILWYIDYAHRLKGETTDSCFIEAVKKIYDMNNKICSKEMGEK